MTHSAEYQAAYRAARPEYTSRMRLLNKARCRALRRLQQEHQRRYAALLSEEMSRLDLKTIGMGGPGVPKKPVVS